MSYNKKALRVDLGKYYKPDPYKKDMNTDPAGLWKFDGPVKVPNYGSEDMEITMDNVNVPVMGIASTGQQQMMMPWQQYTFPGADYVNEYPIMKVGGIPELPLTAGRKAYRTWGYTNNDFIVNRQEGGGSDVSGYAYNVSGEGPALGLGIDYNKNNFSAGIEGEVPLYRNSGYGFNPSLRLGYNIPISNNLNLNLNASGNLSKEGANPQFGAGLRYSFDEGGYIEAELTPDEIKWYKDRGYRIEDID